MYKANDLVKKRNLQVIHPVVDLNKTYVSLDHNYHKTITFHHDQVFCKQYTVYSLDRTMGRFGILLRVLGLQIPSNRDGALFGTCSR